MVLYEKAIASTVRRYCDVAHVLYSVGIVDDSTGPAVVCTTVRDHMGCSSIFHVCLSQLSFLWHLEGIRDPEHERQNTSQQRVLPFPRQEAKLTATLGKGR